MKYSIPQFVLAVIVVVTVIFLYLSKTQEFSRSRRKSSKSSSRAPAPKWDANQLRCFKMMGADPNSLKAQSLARSGFPCDAKLARNFPR